MKFSKGDVVEVVIGLEAGKKEGIGILVKKHLPYSMDENKDHGPFRSASDFWLVYIDNNFILVREKYMKRINV